MRVQVYSGTIVQGDANAVGHVICASAGSGTAKQSVNYVTERVVGNGSFGVVFQATCQETGEVVSAFCFIVSSAYVRMMCQAMHLELFWCHGRLLCSLWTTI